MKEWNRDGDGSVSGFCRVSYCTSSYIMYYESSTSYFRYPDL